MYNDTVEVVKMCLDEIRVLEIGLAVRVPQPKGKVAVFDSRENCGLLFCEYGKLSYESGGRVYISDNTHPLFLPKGISYTLRGIEESSTFVINFSIRETGEPLPPVSFSGPATSSVSRQLSALERLWTLRRPSYRFRSFSVLYELLAALPEPAENSYLPTAKREKIRASVDYIERHFCDDNISNDLIADQSGISTVYFRKLFQEIYGIPPMRYVHRLRTEKAQAMLRSGYATVSETAAAVGFSSIYHFSRAFKSAVGVSPARYMKSPENR